MSVRVNNNINQFFMQTKEHFINAKYEVLILKMMSHKM